LVAEPGRYVVADAGVLLARVTHVKPGPPRFVGLDAGMQTLLRPALYGAYHPVYPGGAPRPGSPRATAICGPVCEPRDVLAVDRLLPRLEAGDLVAVGITGAYGYAMASPYNGWPRPAEVLVRKGRAFRVRRRETRAALTRDCITPKHLLNSARERSRAR
jgi:diaminopimelate decarboxylase